MLMTAAQVAKHMGVCTRTVYRMKDRGEIPYYQTGSRVRFKLSEVEEAIRCQKTRNGAP